MDGNEKIGAVLISHPGPVNKLNKFIGFPRINNFYVGKVLFDVITKFQGNFQGNVGFLGAAAVATRIFPPVAGIYYYCTQTVSLFRITGKRRT